MYVAQDEQSSTPRTYPWRPADALMRFAATSGGSVVGVAKLDDTETYFWSNRIAGWTSGVPRAWNCALESIPSRLGAIPGMGVLAWCTGGSRGIFKNGVAQVAGEHLGGPAPAALQCLPPVTRYCATLRHLLPLYKSCCLDGAATAGTRTVSSGLLFVCFRNLLPLPIEVHHM